MKAIVSVGWTPSLIPDDYIKNAFFMKELDEFEELEARTSELDATLSGLLDEIEIDENDDEESDKTIKSVKSYLNEQIRNLKDTTTESARKEKSVFEIVLNKLEAKERELKDMNKLTKEKTDDLGKKLEDKRKTFGEDEAKGLILQKLQDIASNQMYGYLNYERRKIVGICEKLWDKYQVPLADITKSRDKASKRLINLFRELTYF
jgi:type I restriction enzyme M protein